MENELEILRQHLIQLKKELAIFKRLLHDSTSLVKECRKGFETISETGNTRVADVFLEGLDSEIDNIK